MSDLAARLYEAHRKALHDPTAREPWGNASTEERGAWAQVDVVVQVLVKEAKIAELEHMRDEVKAAYLVSSQKLATLLDGLRGAGVTDAQLEQGLANAKASAS